MLANEALDILGLKSGATSAEIKEAYRDLVKVWHPDRFADDSRLRRKAEDKLKHLNDAYQTLKSGTAESTRPTSSGRTSTPPPPNASAPRGSATASRRGLRPGPWFYILFPMLLVGLVGFAVYEIEPDDAATNVTSALPRVERSIRTPGTDNSQPEKNTPSAVPTSGNDSSPFHVRDLSDAESTQLQSACGSLQELSDASAYQACIRAELAVITNASGSPDLSSLTSAEHESIQIACSNGTALQTRASHDRCLTVQMAELAASPARPDLSGLSDADLASVESACATVKTRGPAAYNRCRIRFARIIAESK